MNKVAQLYSHTRWHKPAEILLLIIDQEQSFWCCIRLAYMLGYGNADKPL